MMYLAVFGAGILIGATLALLPDLSPDPRAADNADYLESRADHASR